jgi:hypothetical protein
VFLPAKLGSKSWNQIALIEKHNVPSVSDNDALSAAVTASVNHAAICPAFPGPSVELVATPWAAQMSDLPVGGGFSAFFVMPLRHLAWETPDMFLELTHVRAYERGTLRVFERGLALPPLGKVPTRPAASFKGK